MCGIAGWYREARVRSRATYRPPMRPSDPSRTRRLRLCSSMAISVSACAGSASSTPSTAISRSPAPTDAIRSSATAKSSITSTCAASWSPATDSAPAATSKPCSRLTSLGRRRLAALRGHVCGGDLGPPLANPHARSRSAGDQAAVHHRAGGRSSPSHPKSRHLREIPGFEFDIDERGVDDFFRFGHVLGPRSIFRQVRALEPGHVMTIGPVGSATRRFWTATRPTRTDLSENEWIEQARERVLGTVRQHMISDVPVGVFLSGGVDSSAVAAAMAHASDGAGFKVFTAGFPGSKIDETLSRIGSRPASRLRAYRPADRAAKPPRTCCPPSSARSMSRPRPTRPFRFGICREPRRSTSRSCFAARAATSCSWATTASAGLERMRRWCARRSRRWRRA